MANSFYLSKEKNHVKIVISENESEAVKIAAKNLEKDLVAAYDAIFDDEASAVIYITTKSDDSYKWEEYRHEVKNGCLYISGGDRRGTIYGIYSFSEMLGISPWYYFADVPVNAPGEIVLKEGYKKADAPTVPYRGIFINDEEELDKWARLHMNENTISVNTYTKVFELILRLKGNYIWPAMHVNSFNMDLESGALAERMGIVVGTSHCDMLMRSNFREWEPWISKKGYYDAKYDYSFEGKNRDILKEYWRESVEQNKAYEVSYTLGMRGIHDSGFITDALQADSEEELMDKKCKLLEKVISDQIEILNTTLKKETLMTFVPYKEVLNLYDRGLEVPEDVTLIWTNDNYGYIRRYPSAKEQERKGGNGVYYHASYWAPTVRHYLFLSSIPVAKTLYEMSKAYDNGIRKLWVCNMGAIKPLEQEMEYFLALGWDYGKENADVMNPDKYLCSWIKKHFKSIKKPETLAELLQRYARVSDTRKVEFMEEDVFAQGPLHNEAAIRLNTLKKIYDEGNKIYSEISKDEKTAFFEMILMKLHAAYYTSAMYYFADRSYLCIKKGKPGLANEYVRLSRGFEDARRKLIHYYNKELAEGKWDGIVTPEDFPPPRTSMHPAGVPALTETDFIEEDRIDMPLSGVKGYIASEGQYSDVRIIKGLGHATKDIVEITETGYLSIPFETGKEGEIIIEIDRYPSLNSVGEISVMTSIDGGEKEILVTDSNDEWRGNWQENITDGVDRLYIKKYLEKGNHQLTLSNGKGYFALSKIVVYENGVVENRLGALKPFETDYAGDELPDSSYLDEACKAEYAKIPAQERVISLGKFVDGVNVMDLTDSFDYPDNEKALFMPDVNLSPADLKAFGSKEPSENDGSVVIEAFSAYNRTPYAYTENVDIDYATGVTYNRTNLALFIRKTGLSFEEEKAPTLHYSFICDGGEYTIYVLMRLYSSKQSRIPMLIDGEPALLSWRNDSPWRYEAEKLFRYVPMCKTVLSPGEHSIDIKLLYSGVRVERIILLK